MKIKWYPEFDDIMDVFGELQQYDKDLVNENLMNERAIKSILDKVRYGLPFKESDFCEKVAILWNDISFEHHFSGWLGNHSVQKGIEWSFSQLHKLHLHVGRKNFGKFE